MKILLQNIAENQITTMKILLQNPCRKSDCNYEDIVLNFKNYSNKIHLQHDLTFYIILDKFWVREQVQGSELKYLRQGQGDIIYNFLSWGLSLENIVLSLKPILNEGILEINGYKMWIHPSWVLIKVWT